MQKEKQLEKALELVIHLQLIAEIIDELPQDIKRQKIKQVANQLASLIEPIIKVNYDKMFFTDEQTTGTIVYEIDKLVKMLSRGGLQKKVFLSQAVEAHETQPQKSEELIHNILINE